MDKQLVKRICVIGAGRWGINHIITLFEMGNLGGIVENDAERLSEFVNKYPTAKGYLNIESALKDGYGGYFTCSDRF